MARKKKIKNILNMIPVRNYEWEEKEKVSVLVPRFRSKIGQKFCKMIKKETTYKVNLDDCSSDAWRLCNGKRTVLEIAKELEKKYKEKVEPANLRVAELFNILEANKLIRYKNLKSHSDYAEGVENGPD
jgi:hypothetical protein